MQRAGSSLLLLRILGASSVLLPRAAGLIANQPHIIGRQIYSLSARGKSQEREQESKDSLDIENKSTPMSLSKAQRCQASDSYATDKEDPWYRKFVSVDNVEYATYMEEEWGHEQHGDLKLFEMLTLEGAQAGLSWSTILKKRENYRKAFDGWNVQKIASYGPKDVARLMSDDGIVRHRGKVESVIGNAKATLEIQKEFGSLDTYLWELGGGEGGKPVLNRQWKALSDAPSESTASIAMSKELKKRGMKFVGSKICYAFMQATGMVVDHPMNSPQWKAAEARLLECQLGHVASTLKRIRDDSHEEVGRHQDGVPPEATLGRVRAKK